MTFCLTCGADQTGAPSWRCPECGGNPREVESIDDPSIYDDPPRPDDLAEYPAVVNRCKCSHPRSAHTAGHDRCWSVVCGCATYRPKEASK